MLTHPTGSRRTEAGPTNHINCLELMAVFFGLKAFCSRMKSAHIYIDLVNTTTVDFAFCVQSATLLINISGSFVLREIWISVALIPGKNTQAHSESRDFINNKEWNCQGQTYFNKLQKSG